MMNGTWMLDVGTQLVPDHEVMNAAMLFLDDLDGAETMLMEDDDDGGSAHMLMDHTGLAPTTMDAFGQPLSVTAMPFHSSELEWQAMTMAQSEHDVANALKVKLTRGGNKPAGDDPDASPMLTAADAPTPTPMHLHRQTTTVAPRPTQRMRTGNRRRQEIQCLRVEAQELEQRLQGLQDRVSHERRIAAARNPEDAAMMTEAWRSIATHQLEQRQRTEETHARLVAMVEEQKKIAKNLQRMIKRHAHAQTSAAATANAAARAIDASHQSLQILPTGPSHELVDSVAFDELDRSLELMYEHTDRVFANPKLDALVAPFRDIHVSGMTINDDPFFEVLDARVVPFDMQATTSAVWKTMSNLARDAPGCQVKALKTTLGTIRRDIAVVLDTPRCRGVLHGKIAMRRYTERHRVIIVWSAIFSPTEIGDLRLEGLEIRRRHWTVIEQCRNARLRGTGRALTQIHTFDVATPRGTEEAFLGHDSAAPLALRQFVGEAIGHHLDLLHQLVENRLLREGMGSRGQFSEIPAVPVRGR